jgi:small-conductance mechanosensitive channel
MDFESIRLIGVSSETAAKLVVTLAVIGAVTVLRLLLVGSVRALTGRHGNDRVLFWTRQGASLTAFLFLLLAVLSIWFDDPNRLGTIVGLATAGLAIAAQKAVTAFAGYLVIMRGKTFTVGDRIKMGGVRGDVIALGFLQTRILEMGQPSDVNAQEDPGMWVLARQFSGRIVTVTNDKVFDEAVYNFTREFPYIWEEMRIPLPYRADRAAAEQILLNAAREATAASAEASEIARERLQARYNVPLEKHDPRVFWRLTDNWLELAVRFVVPEHGIRDVKDRITRAVLHEFDAKGIEIASATFEVTGVPPLRLERGPDEL